MTFSRYECIAAVRDYYQFLAKMFMDESRIMEPPPGGWPNITPRALSALNKTEEVVSLLRHLPYIDDSDVDNHPQCIPFTTFANWNTLADKEIAPSECWGILVCSEDCEEGFGREEWAHRTGCDVPSRFVGLTFGGRNNDILVLDTASGRIHWPDCPGELQGHRPLPSELEIEEAEVLVVEENTIAGQIEHRDADEEDRESSSADSETPPTSEDGGQDSSEDDNDNGDNENDNDNDDSDNGDNSDQDTDSESEHFLEEHASWPVVEFFEICKSHYRQLNFVAVNKRRVIEAWNFSEGDLPLLRSIYRKHGWPDLEVYQKKACLAEVAKVLHEKYPDHYSEDEDSDEDHGE
jgi:hypothetical protein